MQLFYDDDFQDLILYSERKCKPNKNNPPKHTQNLQLNSTEPDLIQSSEVNNSTSPGFDLFLATVRLKDRHYNNSRARMGMSQTEGDKMLKERKSSPAARERDCRELQELVLLNSSLQSNTKSRQQRQLSQQDSQKQHRFQLLLPFQQKRRSQSQAPEKPNLSLQKPRGIKLKSKLEAKQLLVNDYFVKPREWIRTPIKSDIPGASGTVGSQHCSGHLCNHSNHPAPNTPHSNAQKLLKLRDSLRRKNFSRRDDFWNGYRGPSTESDYYHPTQLPNISLSDKKILSSLIEYTTNHLSNSTPHKTNMKMSHRSMIKSLHKQRPNTLAS